MSAPAEIWVFGDHRNYYQDRLTLQVLAHARDLAAGRGLVTVVVLGYAVEEIAKEYVAHGAERVLWVEHPDLKYYQPELFSSILCELLKEEPPEVLLLGASDFGRELAPGIAKRLKVGLSADVIALEWDEDKKELVSLSPAFGGQVLAKIAWSERRPRMATIRPGIFSERPHDNTAQGEIIKKTIQPPPSTRLKLVASDREPRRAQKLEEAKVVVAGGRGLKNAEGFHALRDLALALGGEVGASRPAVDAHWASHDQLLGQTGKTVKPSLLISCGASGAIQYTAGIQGAETIVAVNRDSHAPIFKYADFGVVADVGLFLPCFTSEVKTYLFKQLAELYRASLDRERGQTEASFGARVKKLREDRQVTLEELAEATGQSPEFIAQVEANAVTPPVSFLLQLSRALAMDPSNFLTAEERLQIDDKRQEAFVKRTQNYSYRTLTPGAADRHLRAFMVTIEPKEKHKMVEYKHPGEEFIFVYSGALELTLGAKVHLLKPGETMHFDSETKHKLRNVSEEKCELIVVLYTP